MNFPFFDLTRQFRPLKKEILAEIETIFDKQAFILGEAVAKFEENVARYIGVKHAVTVASGTDALVLALKAMEIQPGDEVITAPFSFFASTSSILLAGAVPVFSDVEAKSFNLDPAKLEKSLTPRTKAIMPVHLFGQCADMQPILEFAAKHGLKIVEDAAQTIGARYQGRGAGTMGLTGAFSFYPTKNLGGAGEGGLVTTNDDSVAERARLLRVHGMKVRYTHDILGWNSRMDSLQAVVLNIKLKHLDGWVRRRRELAMRYNEAFDGLEKQGRIVLPREMPGCDHVWNQYTVLIDHRDDVRAKLAELKIPTEVYYPKTLPVQPALRFLGIDENRFPISVDLARRAMSLPVFPELTDSEHHQVIDAVKKVLA